MAKREKKGTASTWPVDTRNPYKDDGTAPHASPENKSATRMVMGTYDRDDLDFSEPLRHPSRSWSEGKKNRRGL